MTSAQREYTVGMRVVVRQGPWEILAPHRIAGHYGKIAEIDSAAIEADQAPIHVDLTGHVDGGHVDEVVLCVTEGWFFPEELDVID